MADNQKQSGPAFGHFPQMKPRRAGKSDVDANVAIPRGLARGALSGVLGAPGDLESLARLPYELITGNESPTYLPTSEDIEKRLPYRGESPLERAATGVGQLGGGLYMGPGAPIRLVGGVPKAVYQAGRDFATAAGQPAAKIFIGPNAKTWNKKLAEAAEDYEKAGRSPQEIWQATGTFRGPDGAWRQEINDRPAQFANKLGISDKLIANRAKEGEIKAAVKESLAREKEVKDLFPKEAVAARKESKEKAKDLEFERKRIYGLDSDPKHTGNFAPHAFEHPELYAAYPDLQKIVVRQGENRGPNMMGQQSGKDIDIFAPGLARNPKSTMAHEMQHAIQDIEKTAPGGNVEMFQRERYEALNKIGALNDRLSMLARHMDEEADPQVKALLQKQFDETMASKLALAPKANIDPHDAYLRLAGEAESRAVQSRLEMTPSERKAKFPLESYDVPVKELDIRPPQGKVSFSDNPDVMQMELGDAQFAGGGLASKLAKLARAAPKSKEEIEAIAQRIAPQVTGEFVRGKSGTQSVAGKTQKQFQREKDLPVDIRPTKGEPLPKPETIDYEKLKGNVFMGIPGDTSITGQTIHGVGDIKMQSPSPQHGGPMYGHGRDDAHFWASGLNAARRVQNLAKEIQGQYDAPVLGKYVMMGPEGLPYAQHFADANLEAIDLSKMTKRQIEGFNNLLRKGSPKSGPRPSFPGIEDKGEAYLHFSMDPELRKHFNQLMEMPTVTTKFGLPSGQDVRFAVTEPDLRNLEVGVTGKSIGQMKPEVEDLKWSEHPTYSHDIPGHFLGSSAYPVPYELSFPDTLKAVRENPKQAPQEFGSLKMVGPRQVIDQQLIDEIKQYEEAMKRLTGKKAGGAIKKAEGGSISADDLILEERKL